VQRLYEHVIKDHFQSNKQMAFVCGPRQVGKTTLAQALQKKTEQSVYRSWDSPNDRPRMVASSFEPILEGLTISPATHPLCILDEIHKHPNWKDYLKGLYDHYQGQMDILVTGSARLNVYRKGGDSLMGRYFLYRAHPLTVGETADRPLTLFQPLQLISQDKIENLLHFGGFPEPWSKGNERFLNRWHHLRQQQLVYEDIRSLEAIQNLSQLELLSTLLKHQAGQLVNYTSLASKVRVTVPTIQRWINALEQVYYCYTIRPWSHNISRSLLKEPKIYLWDWSLITDAGARYENFVASHLLKAVHFWTDIGLGVFGLNFIRTKDQKEVDFLVTKDERPWMLLEVKSSSKAPLSKSIREYKEILGCPFAFQVVFDLPSTDRGIDWLSTHVREGGEAPAVIMPAASILSMLV
jgi:uncharacterized protein